jgi:hypothetical protein
MKSYKLACTKRSELRYSALFVKCIRSRKFDWPISMSRCRARAHLRLRESMSRTRTSFLHKALERFGCGISHAHCSSLTTLRSSASPRICRCSFPTNDALEYPCLRCDSGPPIPFSHPANTRDLDHGPAVRGHATNCATIGTFQFLLDFVWTASTPVPPQYVSHSRIVNRYSE